MNAPKVDFATLIALNDQSTDLARRANELFKGRPVRITSKFNGQSRGFSRKPLTGRVFVIDIVYLNEWGKPSFFSWQCPDAGFSIDDCELVEEQ